ncbi:amidase signature domain-containing protein [Boeremia exigua]|uniref:amidase signature domain-containing protein n=1 Tax=Boeremia exigua TaxID=749465 RepID=UPI001E8DB6E2|nr:amidase signature domain-containing protein [Boeremia exigua]KAH6643515.1 amidase signature domain-containing protein [Boeremia exigua]
MASGTLELVRIKGLPPGTDEFETRRAAISKEFARKVPSELLLPSELITNPPNDVTNIPRTCGVLTDQEIEVTESYDAVALADVVASRRLTAVEVTTAFAKRSMIAHQLTCCLTQWFMDEALHRAKELDDYLEKHGKPIGPLHGVPISIKEHIPVAGTYSSQGSLSSTVLDKEDSHMVSILRAAGAIFYCKTNQPQAVMHLESTSHYGRTLNPFNLNLSAGGSTGGEAALLAMRGSVLGVGTDIGGSIRGPSAFCGIYGFKATSETLPMKGFLANPFAAELNISCSTGPMCSSLRDMDLFIHVLHKSQPWLLDPSLVPIPWTGLSTHLSKPLKIGIIEDDGFIVPQPPVRRVIEWAKLKLINPELSSVLNIKPFQPYGAENAWRKIRRMYWPDGGAVTKAAIQVSGEPILPLSDQVWSDAEPFGMLNAEEINQLRFQRDQFRHAFSDSWNEQDVDIVLGPAFVGPACAHDTAFYWTYTSLYNYVDYPAAVVPTPVRARKEENYPESYTPLSVECEHVRKLWSEGSFEGAPINLQIVARRHHDNLLFGALELLRPILDLP